jgi:hypothetical protein
MYEVAYVRISENECVAVGGRDESNTPSAKIQLLTRSESGDKITVTQCGDMNDARYNAAAIYYHDAIYISGGEDGSGKLKSVECVMYEKGVQ